MATNWIPWSSPFLFPKEFANRSLTTSPHSCGWLLIKLRCRFLLCHCLCSETQWIPQAAPNSPLEFNCRPEGLLGNSLFSFLSQSKIPQDPGHLCHLLPAPSVMESYGIFVVSIQLPLALTGHNFALESDNTSSVCNPRDSLDDHLLLPPYVDCLFPEHSILLASMTYLEMNVLPNWSNWGLQNPLTGLVLEILGSSLFFPLAMLLGEAPI